MTKNPRICQDFKKNDPAERFWRKMLFKKNDPVSIDFRNFSSDFQKKRPRGAPENFGISDFGFGGERQKIWAISGCIFKKNDPVSIDFRIFSSVFQKNDPAVKNRFGAKRRKILTFQILDLARSARKFRRFSEAFSKK